MTPTFDFPVFRYRFLPRHSYFRVCCTSHSADLPCHPYCRVYFHFPIRAVLFRDQFARFHIALHRPARPLSFGQLSCVRILVCCGLPWSVFAPVSNLAPLFPTCGFWRKCDMYSHLCSPLHVVGRSSYRSAHTHIYIYYIPSHLLSSPFCSLSLLLIVVTQIRGHMAGCFPPLPTTVRALHCALSIRAISFSLFFSSKSFPRIFQMF